MTNEQTQDQGKNQVDIYSEVTQKIIADLEKGELSWRKPWAEGGVNTGRPLRSNGVPYTGVNTVLLWMQAAERGFVSPYWMTFRQAEELQAKVKTGEKGSHVVFTEKVLKEEEDENGEIQKRQSSFLKVYTVFNADQVEGLPDHFYNLPKEKVSPKTRVKKIEQFFGNTGAKIITGSRAAYYNEKDIIEMPPFESFKEAVRYYGTLSHEVTHWTKHESRLNRDFNQKRFADDGYALEELVAELGACFLAADLGFEPVIREEHSAYIQSWLKVLKHDKRFVFQAAGHAQKAVEYLTNLQPVKSEKKPQVVASPS